VNLRPFDKIELKRPHLAPASRLYHLEPLGLGTPFVESLTSFTVRLASAHCVTTGVLTAEIARQVDKPYLFERGYIKVFRDTVAINGVSNFARQWVRALEKSCSRDDLSFLTMLPWAEVLPEHSLLRKNRVWCPDCYGEMSNSASGVYDPLLWFLRPVLVCIIHDCLLCCKCPTCGEESRPLSGKTRPGLCPKCQSWLGRKINPDSTPEEGASFSDLKLQKRYGVSLGDLLSVGPTISSPSRKVIANSLSSIIGQVAGGNAAASARYLNRNKSVICTWQRCEGRMRIADMLDICDRVGISLVDFLTEKTGLATMSDEIILRVRKVVVPKRRNWGHLELTLQAVLDNNEQISLGDLSSRLGCDRRTLRYHFPELCRAICARWTKQRTELVRNRRTKAKETIRNVVLSLLGEGIYPSRRAVCARLEVKIRSRVVGTELTKLQAESGWSHLRRNVGGFRDWQVRQSP
jgi:hypothetical protein